MPYAGVKPQKNQLGRKILRGRQRREDAREHWLELCPAAPDLADYRGQDKQGNVSEVKM
jgi:hypothetical protein